MSAKTVQISSPYGPINVDLLQCDGPNCASCAQKQYVIAWQRLEYQGIPAPTFGNAKLPDGMDFCSIECLKQTIDIMTGSTNG